MSCGMRFGCSENELIAGHSFDSLFIARFTKRFSVKVYIEKGPYSKRTRKAFRVDRKSPRTKFQKIIERAKQQWANSQNKIEKRYMFSADSVVTKIKFVCNNQSRFFVSVIYFAMFFSFRDTFFTLKFAVSIFEFTKNKKRKFYKLCVHF